MKYRKVLLYLKLGERRLLLHFCISGGILQHTACFQNGTRRLQGGLTSSPLVLQADHSLPSHDRQQRGHCLGSVFPNPRAVTLRWVLGVSSALGLPASLSLKITHWNSGRNSSSLVHPDKREQDKGNLYGVPYHPVLFSAYELV